MFSVLAAMGLLEHGNPSPLGEKGSFTKRPTDQDYNLSQWLWSKALVSKKSKK